MEPTTAIAIAQAGQQIFALARSGGGRGTEGLLAAQTQMLKALSAQMVVINERLKDIYDDVQDLKRTVASLPASTAVEVVRLQLGGGLRTAGEIFGARASHQLSGGQAFALASVKERAEHLLRELNLHRNSLIHDGSVALCPAICAAWYTELQLLTSCVPLDMVRIRIAAETYEQELHRWITEIIEPTLTNLRGALQAQIDGILAAERWRDHTCYQSVRRWVESGGGGGGRDRGSEPWEIWHVEGTQIRYAAVPAANRPVLDVYRTELATLSDMGMACGPDSAGVLPWDWSVEVQHRHWDSGRVYNSRDANRIVETEAEMRKILCADPGTHDAFVADETARGGVCEQILADIVVYGHFFQACRDALASVRGILVRSDQLIL